MDCKKNVFLHHQLLFSDIKITIGFVYYSRYYQTDKYTLELFFAPFSKHQLALIMLTQNFLFRLLNQKSTAYSRLHQNQLRAFEKPESWVFVCEKRKRVINVYVVTTIVYGW